MRDKIAALLLLSALGLAPACASTNQQNSAAVGAALGAASGAVIGHQYGDGGRDKGALIGAAVGGAAGLLFGQNQDQIDVQRQGPSSAR
ncbi:MAG: glycine zipper 2TM domain-containing protein [Nitrospinae bacterium]|nr:glycine zipper 2TM domain-containing protein [Nitrospinota bacterium]